MFQEFRRRLLYHKYSLNQYIQEHEETYNMQSKHYDVVIVGAGVIGCAIAYYAARAGMQVAIVDKESVASEASQVSAGGWHLFPVILKNTSSHLSASSSP